MFKKTLLALSIASLSTISPLNSEEKNKGIYFVGSIGISQMADSDINSSAGGQFNFDGGSSSEFGVGYDFGNIRTDLTYTSTITDISHIKGKNSEVGVDVQSFLISAAYDLRADKQWQPYIGAGIGTATVNVNQAVHVDSTILPVGDDNVGTFKFKAGLSYAASDKLDVYGEYWGQTIDDFTIGSVTFVDNTISGGSLGVRVRF
tara:strand:+ start:3470 stop:4081 length:612 start_codon:yes stop_codon:yes gene_type:complete